MPAAWPVESDDWLPDGTTSRRRILLATARPRRKAFLTSPWWFCLISATTFGSPYGVANNGWPAVAEPTDASQAVAARASPGAVERQVVKALASASRAGSTAQVMPARRAVAAVAAPP